MRTSSATTAKPFRCPNVVANNVVQYVVNEDGEAIARTGYDFDIGTMIHRNVVTPNTIQGWAELDLSYENGEGAMLSLFDDGMFPDNPGVGEYQYDGLASGTDLYLRRYGTQIWIRQDNSYEHYYGT